MTDSWGTPSHALRALMRRYRRWLEKQDPSDSLGTCVDCDRVIPATELFVTCATCDHAVCVDCLDAHDPRWHGRPLELF